MPDVTVYFATNREEIVAGDTVVGFGQGLNPKSPLWLRYGSADLRRPGRRRTGPFETAELRVAPEVIPGVTATDEAPPLLGSASVYDGLRKRLIERSEEHTSELQSLMRISYAVFCLKKKNTNHETN